MNPALESHMPTASTEFIQVDQLKNQIDESGIALDLELIIPSFSWASYRHPRVPLEQFRDSMSPHQIYSKAWILKTLLDIAEHFTQEDEEVDPRLLNLALYRGEDVSLTYFGSWLGFGAAMVAGIGEYFSSGTIKKVTLVDQDPLAIDYAVDVITALGFNSRHINQNMLLIHPHDNCWQEDIIVNPIVEHLTLGQMQTWWEIIRASEVKNKKRLIVLQSTDMPASDHVNPCSGAEELKYEGMDVLYAGELRFKECSRYMVVGTI